MANGIRDPRADPEARARCWTCVRSSRRSSFRASSLRRRESAPSLDLRLAAHADEEQSGLLRFWGSEQSDPAYVQTNQVLADYRAQLQIRSLSIGPPPYANCP